MSASARTMERNSIVPPFFEELALQPRGVGELVGDHQLARAGCSNTFSIALGNAPGEQLVSGS